MVPNQRDRRLIPYAAQQTQLQLSFLIQKQLIQEQLIQILFQVFKQSFIKLSLQLWLQPLIFVAWAEFPLLDESQQPSELRRSCAILQASEPSCA